MEKTDILSLTLPELELEMIKLGEKKFRAKQIFQWLHVKQIRDFSEMSNISLELRTKISENFCLKSLNMVRRLESCIDNTVKYLYVLNDGKYIEYNRKNHPTKILVTEYLKNIQFEYDIQNEYYKGHWCGQFAPLKDGGCVMYLLFYFESVSFLGKFINVDKFEKRYIEDLKKELNEYSIDK